MRIAVAVIFTTFLLLSVATASNRSSLSTLEFHWLCASHSPQCESIEAIGDSAPFGVEKLAFFTTRSASNWSECQHFGEPFICVTLGANDMERLNTFATPAHRHDSAVLVYKGKVVAIFGFIGPTRDPLYFGGSNGAMSTNDVKAFFTSGQ